MMTIDEIFTELDKEVARMADKAKSARKVAKDAYRKGEMKKWDKFNAVARVYEMLYWKLGPLTSELTEHTSEGLVDDDIPF